MAPSYFVVLPKTILSAAACVPGGWQGWPNSSAMVCLSVDAEIQWYRPLRKHPLPKFAGNRLPRCRRFADLQSGGLGYVVSG